MIATITVYDGNPSRGPGAWPDTYRGKLIGGEVSARAKRRILRDARKCREYQRGDKLWLIARDSDGINLCDERITI